MKAIPRALKPWLVAVAMALLGWWLRLGSPSPAQPRLLAEIPVDLVSRVEATKAGRTLVFERVGDQWRQTAPLEQPADPAAMRRLLVAMADARVIQATPLAQAPPRAGLDDAAVRLKAVWPAGSAVLVIGKRHPAGLAWLGEVESGVGGLGPSDLHRLLVEGDPTQLRSARLFDRAGAESDRVFIQANSGAQRMQVSLERRDGHWRLVDPVEARADNAAVADFLEAVARLEHQGIVDDAPKDLSLFGLAEPAAAVSIRSLDVSRGVLSEEVLDIGGDGPAGPGGRFGKRRDRPGVFQLDQRCLATLLPPGAAFIDATMLGVEPAEVKSVAIRTRDGAAVAELERGVAAWTLRTPGAAERPVAAPRLRDLLQALCAARAVDLATESIPAAMVSALLEVRLADDRVAPLTIGKDAQGRWLVGDGGGITRVYPAAMAFPLDPAALAPSNR